MSEPLPLPDDPASWPRDPWQLFALPRGADRREVRRAYARLIRVYKPEHFPVQFRLIRDAYELLDAQSSMDDDLPQADPLVSRPRPPATAASTPDAPEEAAWRLAEEGRLDEAFREHLRLWDGAGRCDEELCLRLYWLRKLYPALDLAADCRDFLVAGLAAHGLPQRLMEVYWRELVRDPQEAFSSRFDGLLSAPATAQQRGELLYLRWQAASALGRFDQFAADLQWARQHIGREDQGAWFKTLLAAMDHLAWETDQQLLDIYHACRKEAAVGAECHLQLDAAFDRADFLGELAAGYHRLRVAPGKLRPFAADLLPLVRISWTQPFSRWQPMLTQWLATALGDPLATLDSLDALGNIAGTVVVRLAALVETLEQHRCDPDSGLSSERRLEKTREFLEAFGLSDYAQFRRNVLCTCLWDRMTTAQFAAAMGEIVAADVLERTGLLRAVHNDVTVDLLSRAALTLWP